MLPKFVTQPSIKDLQYYSRPTQNPGCQKNIEKIPKCKIKCIPKFRMCDLGNFIPKVIKNCVFFRYSTKIDPLKCNAKTISVNSKIITGMVMPHRNVFLSTQRLTSYYHLKLWFWLLGVQIIKLLAPSLQQKGPAVQITRQLCVNTRFVFVSYFV